MNKVKDIFEHTDCISEDMLTKYISGKLSSVQKHEVEKHLIDCEMCSDAVEGLSSIGDTNKIPGITSQLNQKIQIRISSIHAKEEKKEVKIIFLQQYRSQLAIAASVVLLLGLVWFFRSNMSMNKMGQESSEKIFADKFEPYATEEDATSSRTPVAESPALNEPQTLIKEKPIVDQTPKDIKSDKKIAENEIAFSDNSGKDGAKGEAGYSPVQMNKKESAAPATSGPRVDALTVQEGKSAASDREKRKQAQQAPEKNITSTSAGSPDALQIRREENRVLMESEKMTENTESLTMETRSKSKNYRAAARDEKAKEATTPAEVQISESANEVLSISMAAGAASQPIKEDTTTAELKVTTDDGDMAIQKYVQKNYSGAAADFEKTLAKDPGNYNALFYSAVSYLSTGETDKAITNLNKVLQKKDGEFYDAAKWYISLAYIKKNDTQNARKNLTELQKNSKSKYQKQADETLREMQK